MFPSLPPKAPPALAGGFTFNPAISDCRQGFYQEVLHSFHWFITLNGTKVRGEIFSTNLVISRLPRQPH
jgi:hypothetical protein